MNVVITIAIAAATAAAAYAAAGNPTVSVGGHAVVLVPAALALWFATILVARLSS